MQVRKRQRPSQDQDTHLDPVEFEISVSHRTPEGTILRVEAGGISHTGKRPVFALAAKLVEAGVDADSPFHMRWRGSDFVAMKWPKIGALAEKYRKDQAAFAVFRKARV